MNFGSGAITFTSKPSSGGGGAYVFDNGITEFPAGIVKLGGNLTKNVVIDGAFSNFSWVYQGLLNFALETEGGQAFNFAKATGSFNVSSRAAAFPGALKDGLCLSQFFNLLTLDYYQTGAVFAKCLEVAANGKVFTNHISTTLPLTNAGEGDPFRFGSVKAGVVAMDLGNYVEISVNGVLVKLAIAV